MVSNYARFQDLFVFEFEGLLFLFIKNAQNGCVTSSASFTVSSSISGFWVSIFEPISYLLLHLIHKVNWNSRHVIGPIHDGLVQQRQPILAIILLWILRQLTQILIDNPLALLHQLCYILGSFHGIFDQRFINFVYFLTKTCQYIQGILLQFIVLL